MVTIQQWLEKESDTSAKKKKLKSIDIKNINKININKGKGLNIPKPFKNLELELEGDLVIDGFDNLEEINLQYSKITGNLTSLTVKNCPKLTSLDCSKNQLIKLSLSACPNLVRLNCMNNKLDDILDNDSFIFELDSEKLTNLDISDNNFPEQDLDFLSRFINLEELQIGNFDDSKIKEKFYNRFYGSLKPLKNMSKLKELGISNTDIRGGLSLLPQSLEKIHCDSKKIPGCGCESISAQLEKYHKEDNPYDHKSLLINELLKEKDYLHDGLKISEEKVNGQIQLLQEANIYPRNILLVGRTGGGKSTLANVLTNREEFEESAGGISKTKEAQTEEFEEEGIKYRVIDTIGFGDTELLTNEVAKRIAETTYSIKDGLNQVLFVIGGRFESKEMEVYELIKEIFFDENIVNYITVVRTRFPSFMDEQKCEDDRQQMTKENKGLFRLFKECKNKIIYVNNLTREEENDLKSRSESRKKVLNYLKDCKEVYIPRNLREYNSRIGVNIAKIKALKDEAGKTKDSEVLDELNKKIEAEENVILQQTAEHVQEQRTKAELRGKNVGLFIGGVLWGIKKIACAIM